MMLSKERQLPAVSERPNLAALVAHYQADCSPAGSPSVERKGTFLGRLFSRKQRQRRHSEPALPAAPSPVPSAKFGRTASAPDTHAARRAPRTPSPPPPHVDVFEPRRKTSPLRRSSSSAEARQAQMQLDRGAGPRRSVVHHQTPVRHSEAVAPRADTTVHRKNLAALKSVLGGRKLNTMHESDTDPAAAMMW